MCPELEARSCVTKSRKRGSENDASVQVRSIQLPQYGTRIPDPLGFLERHVPAGRRGSWHVMRPRWHGRSLQNETKSIEATPPLAAARLLMKPTVDFKNH